MGRVLLTTEELQDWLTARLRTFTGCEKCNFLGIAELKEPDEDECNWSDSLFVRITGVSSEIYKPAITNVVIEARSKFNVKRKLDIPMTMGTAKIEMQRRLLYVGIFHIDTNCINARQKLDSMNQIERWAANGVILINMPNTSYNEARSGNNVERTQKADTHVYTLTSVDQDTTIFHRIKNAIFPDDSELNQNQINDIKIICDAVHWKAILVTRDGNSRSQPGGILGNRHKLQDIVRIMSDEEAVEFIRKKIVDRDAFNRQVATETGQPIPEWTGMD